jgi:uncharacterized protein YebE (UPF0316 family)
MADGTVVARDGAADSKGMLQLVEAVLYWFGDAPPSWWALTWPGLVVAALRVIDITINVFRTIAVVNGRRVAAVGFAALEAAVWLAAAGIVFADLSAPRFIGFVAGIAAGTWVGMAVVERARIGLVTVRAFVGASEGRELAGHILAERLRKQGYRATLFEGWGREGRVQMILSVVPRRIVDELIETIERTDPDAFVAVDDHASGFIGNVGRARV